MRHQLVSIFGAVVLSAGVGTAAAAGSDAASKSGAKYAAGGYCKVPFCIVTLTATGPSPSNVKMHAGEALDFVNADSAPHTVVFANGLCTLTVQPGPWSPCGDPFAHYVGSYPYTVDGKFPGTVITTPLRRVVTLTARAHSIAPAARLTLHGQVGWTCPAPCFTARQKHFPVLVLARHDRNHAFEPIATVPERWGKLPGRWELTVQPDVTTTYIARVTWQFPQGRIWATSTSSPFTVRIRH